MTRLSSTRSGLSLLLTGSVLRMSPFTEHDRECPLFTIKLTSYTIYLHRGHEIKKIYKNSEFK